MKLLLPLTFYMLTAIHSPMLLAASLETSEEAKIPDGDESPASKTTNETVHLDYKQQLALAQEDYADFILTQGCRAEDFFSPHMTEENFLLKEVAQDKRDLLVKEGKFNVMELVFHFYKLSFLVTNFDSPWVGLPAITCQNQGYLRNARAFHGLSYEDFKSTASAEFNDVLNDLRQVEELIGENPESLKLIPIYMKRGNLKRESFLDAFLEKKAVLIPCCYDPMPSHSQRINLPSDSFAHEISHSRTTLRRSIHPGSMNKIILDRWKQSRKLRIGGNLNVFDRIAFLFLHEGFNFLIKEPRFFGADALSVTTSCYWVEDSVLNQKYVDELGGFVDTPKGVLQIPAMPYDRFFDERSLFMTEGDSLSDQYKQFLSLRKTLYSLLPPK